MTHISHTTTPVHPATLTLPPAPHTYTHTHLPVVEHRQAERLSLSVGSKVSLKAKRVYGWNKRLDSVEGRSRDGGVLGHMTTSPSQDGIH